MLLFLRLCRLVGSLRTISRMDRASWLLLSFRQDGSCFGFMLQQYTLFQADASQASTIASNLTLSLLNAMVIYLLFSYLATRSTL